MTAQAPQPPDGQIALITGDEVTFFCGGSRNVHQFVGLFTKVFIRLRNDACSDTAGKPSLSVRLVEFSVLALPCGLQGIIVILITRGQGAFA